MKRGRQSFLRVYNRLANTVTLEKLQSGVAYATSPVLVKFIESIPAEVPYLMPT